MTVVSCRWPKELNPGSPASLRRLMTKEVLRQKLRTLFCLGHVASSVSVRLQSAFLGGRSFFVFVASCRVDGGCWCLVVLPETGDGQVLGPDAPTRLQAQPWSFITRSPHPAFPPFHVHIQARNLTFIRSHLPRLLLGLRLVISPVFSRGSDQAVI
jgi:hypothetical protein